RDSFARDRADIVRKNRREKGIRVFKVVVAITEAERLRAGEMMVNFGSRLIAILPRRIWETCNPRKSVPGWRGGYGKKIKDFLDCRIQGNRDRCTKNIARKGQVFRGSLAQVYGLPLEIKDPVLEFFGGYHSCSSLRRPEALEL